ncbi:MAG: Prefoldin [Monoraphidium minutum]|nr:MAG: Prefoldin [Monoraphidium minutum]
MTELQRQLDRELEAFREVQRDMQKTVQTKAQLLSQSNENEMVMEELGRLDEDSNVFKLIGPALIKQDLTEARANVSKRLDYIRGESARVDALIKGLQDKAAARQTEIMKLQKRAAGAAGGS